MIVMLLFSQASSVGLDMYRHLGSWTVMAEVSETQDFNFEISTCRLD
jgi:hypothetical protein